MILTEYKLLAQFVLLSGSKIYFFWQKYTSHTKYFFGSLNNWSLCLLIQIIIGKRASHPTGQHQERVKRSHSDHVQHHRGHRPGLRGPCGHQAVHGSPQPGRRLPDPPLLAAGAHEEGRGGYLGSAVPPLQVALNIFSWHSKYSWRNLF